MRAIKSAAVPVQQDTREKILNAAEHLFTEHGFDGTSLRMITGAAKVNLAAVNYHFGSKETLFQQIFQRRLKQLNLARLQILDGLETRAKGQPLKPSQVLEGFFGPVMQMASDIEGGGHIFMRLLSRTYTEPAQFVRQFIAQEYAEVLQRYTSALRRALPDVPMTEIVWRLHFMIGAVSYALSGIDAFELVTGHLQTDDKKMLGPRLMAFLMGGLRAPLPER